MLVDDEEGRPRVLDFGLARLPGTTDLSAETADSPVSEPADEPARLTTPGAVLGTPAYMAPEQLAGGEADARSDIFSFCAALHEALHGARPFVGEHRETLHTAIVRGEVHRPARATEVPAWLRSMVESGLAAEPAARWQAMDPLLLALGRGAHHRRRRALLIAGCVAAAIAAVVTVLVTRHDQQVQAVAEHHSAQVRNELAQTRVARADEQRHGEARRLAALSVQVAAQDPVTGILLALEAVATHTRADASPIVEAEQALLDALDDVRSRPFLRPGAAVIDAIAESPDGRWLATGERDGSVTLWATDHPRSPLVLLPADGHAVYALAFAADHVSLAAARAGDGVQVWTLPARTKVADSDDPPVPRDRLTPSVRWDSPAIDLRDLEWHPRGTALLARAGDLAYVLRPGRPPLPLPGHTAPVRRAVWSRDGAQLVTASADGSARVWPAHGGTPRVIRLADNRRGLWSAEFSPDGRELALAAADHSAAIVSLRDGSVVRLRGHTDEVYVAAFSPDGERVITVARDDSARVWERDGSSTRITLEGHGEALGGVRLGPGRDLLLGTPPGGAAWLWQIDRPGPPLVLHGHAGSVVAARFSADGRRILTASADGSARRWHFADDPDLLRGHDAGIDHASFAPNGRSIVTASTDGTTRIWHRDGRPPWLLRGHREGSEVVAAFSPDSERLASVGSDGKARLWGLASSPPELLANLSTGRDRHAPLLDLAWSPDGQRLAIAGDDGRIDLITIDARARVGATDVLAGHGGPVRVLAFSPDGTRLASAGDDGEIRLWRVREAPVSSDILKGHTGPVHSLAFTGDGAQLISAGDDAIARIWPVTAPGPPRLLRGHGAAIWQARPFLNDAIVTASADGTARLWPPGGGVPTVLIGHTDAVWVAAPGPDGLLVTTSSDGTARLWRPRGETHTAVSLPQRGTATPGEPDHTLWTGSFSPDGRLVLTAGADGLGRVFPVELAAQVAEGCARAGRSLGPEAWKRQVGEHAYQPTCPDRPQ